ncbi:MAG: hypothetical protein GC180_07520 [Bacteroidetes bacterium]|nr:hypothetical protein [Bacteroidota bacterium]
MAIKLIGREGDQETVDYVNKSEESEKDPALREKRIERIRFANKTMLTASAIELSELSEGNEISVEKRHR